MGKDNDDTKELEKLFKKIENLKEFKDWFGVKCPSFHALCGGCIFWNKWEKFKIEISEVFAK